MWNFETMRSIGGLGKAPPCQEEWGRRWRSEGLRSELVVWFMPDVVVIYISSPHAGKCCVCEIFPKISYEIWRARQGREQERERDKERGRSRGRDRRTVSRIGKQTDRQTGRPGRLTECHQRAAAHMTTVRQLQKPPVSRTHTQTHTHSGTHTRLQHSPVTTDRRQWWPSLPLSLPFSCTHSFAASAVIVFSYFCHHNATLPLSICVSLPLLLLLFLSLFTLFVSSFHCVAAAFDTLSKCVWQLFSRVFNAEPPPCCVIEPLSYAPRAIRLPSIASFILHLLENRFKFVNTHQMLSFLLENLKSSQVIWAWFCSLQRLQVCNDFCAPSLNRNRLHKNFS